MTGTDIGRLLTNVGWRLKRGAVINDALGSRIDDGRGIGGLILDGDGDRVLDETGSDIAIYKVVQNYIRGEQIENSTQRGEQ